MACEYRTAKRIEFADTDMAGIAHFSRFYVFMEQAAHAFLRSLGLSVHTEIDGDLVSWPRLAAHCSFNAPVAFEDEIDIRLYVKRKGTRSLTYGCEFTCGGVSVASGELTAACCVCNLGEKMRAIDIPPAFANAIEEAPEV